MSAALLAIDQQISDITHSRHYQQLVSTSRNHGQQLELERIRLELSTLRARRQLLAPAEVVIVPRRSPAKPTVTRQVTRGQAAPAPAPEPKMPAFKGKRPMGLTVQKAKGVTRGRGEAPEEETPEEAPPLRNVRAPRAHPAAVTPTSTPMDEGEEATAPPPQAMEEDVRPAPPIRLARRPATAVARRPSVPVHGQQRTRESAGEDEEVPRATPVRSPEGKKPSKGAGKAATREAPEEDDFAVENVEEELPLMPPTMEDMEEVRPKPRKGKK